MAQTSPLESLAGKSLQQNRRILVGQVPTFALDSAFEMLGIRSRFKHFLIVVAFNNNGVKRLEDVFEPLERMPKIGQDSHAMRFVFDHERDSVNAIVGRWN